MGLRIKKSLFLSLTYSLIQKQIQNDSSSHKLVNSNFDFCHMDIILIHTQTSEIAQIDFLDFGHINQQTGGTINQGTKNK